MCFLLNASAPRKQNFQEGIQHVWDSRYQNGPRSLWSLGTGVGFPLGECALSGSVGGWEGGAKGWRMNLMECIWFSWNWAYLMYFISSLYVCSEVLQSSHCSTLCSSLDILQSIDIWVLVMNDSLLTISFLLVPLNLGRSANTVDVTVTWHKCCSCCPAHTQTHASRKAASLQGQPHTRGKTIYVTKIAAVGNSKVCLESVVQTKVRTNYFTVDSRVILCPWKMKPLPLTIIHMGEYNGAFIMNTSNTIPSL